MTDLSVGRWLEAALEEGEHKEAAKESQVGHGAGGQRRWRDVRRLGEGVVACA